MSPSSDWPQSQGPPTKREANRTRRRNERYRGGRSSLSLHHVIIQVPWHNSGWNGSVCARPFDNTSCLILPRIGEGKRDDVEAGCAGQRVDELSAGDLPPCVGE